MSDEQISEIFRFRKFPVYQDMRNFRKQLKSFTKDRFPKEEQYNLTSQLWRALDSVVLNIAEGSDRYSGKANSNFLNIAIGSLDEVVACVDSASDDNYMGKADQMLFLNSAASIMRQLRALCSVTRKNLRSH